MSEFLSEIEILHVRCRGEILPSSAPHIYRCEFCGKAVRIERRADLDGIRR